MAYILRTHLKKKYLFQGLQSIYGIGKSLSLEICQRLGFQKSFQLKNLSEEDSFQISQCVEDLNLAIKGELEREEHQRLERLLSLKTFRGIRHRQGLPVRGQRTHTNARTQKRRKYSKAK